MAAKKAPMRKMAKPVAKTAARKAPVKKAVAAKKPAAKKSTVGSANAAEERMYQKKMKQPIAMSDYSENYSKNTKKAGMDARGRATKYGKATSPTVVGGEGGKLGQKTWATTHVTSKRGNSYVVNEEKKQRRFLPDSRKVTVTPTTITRGATGRRDAKFGPAPKAPKRKGK